jgi:sugar-specific transcriptional regulator TrmB
MDTLAKRLAGVFNLSDYEARLYFAALDEGETTVSALAKRASIPRTAVYPPLKSLTQKGFVSPLKSKGRRVLYRATEPKHLQHLFERRKIDLQEIVEQFSSSLMSGSGDVWVRYFEGRDGILTAGRIFMEEASKVKLWKTFENPAIAERATGTRQFDEYINERVRRGISGRIIIPSREHSPWMKEIMSRLEEKKLEVRLVSPDEYPIEAAVAVAGDWLYIQSVKQKPFALVIKNTALARTVESIHDMVWDRWSN